MKGGFVLGGRGNVRLAQDAGAKNRTKVLCPNSGAQQCTVECNEQLGYENSHSEDGSVLCGVCFCDKDPNGRCFHRTDQGCKECPDKMMLLGGVTTLAVITYFLFIWRAVHNEGQEHRGTAFWRIVISYFMVNAGLANGLSGRMPPALDAGNW